MLHLSIFSHTSIVLLFILLIAWCYPFAIAVFCPPVLFGAELLWLGKELREGSECRQTDF
jgi:hypothetical protein